MLFEQKTFFYYVTLMNENYVMRDCYKFSSCLCSFDEG